MSPTPVAVALPLFTRTSPIAAVLTSWALGNPVTTEPIYYFSFVLGKWICPRKLHGKGSKSSLDVIMNGDWSQTLYTVMNMSWETAVVLFVGALVFALPCTVITYALSLIIFTRQR